MGTPQFAAASLERLIQNKLDIIGVVTQPDRPKGRGMVLQPCDVKCLALKHDIPVWQPTKVSSPEFLEVFRELHPDLVVVVAFGQKIPAEILFEPEYGCINVHGSLLPKYRGAAPIQWSVLNGDKTAGVTTMYMDEGWDTGDLIYQAATPVGPDENFACLYLRLANLGADLLVTTIEDIQKGLAPRIPQNHPEATNAPKLNPDLAEIRWDCPSATIHNIVRVLAPCPGAETYFQNERLKIIETRIVDCEISENLEPGMVGPTIKKQGFYIGTGDKPLLITKIQPCGKRMMEATDYANGRRLKCGMFFGKEN